MSENTQIAPFPNDLHPPDKKANTAFGEQIFRSVYERFRNGRYLYGNGFAQYCERMRLYATGRQSSAPYLIWLNGKQKDGNARKGYTNISFANTPIAPKETSIIKKIVLSNDFDIDVSSVSKETTSKKAYNKEYLYYDSNVGNRLRKAASEAIGSHIRENEYYFVPKNKQENELYERLGGYKLPFEVAMTKMCKNAFNQSNWTQKSGAIVDSLLQNSWAILKLQENLDGSVTFRHVKTADYGCSYIEDDSIESPYEFDFEYVPFQKLIPGLKKAYPNITESELEAIAKSNIGFNTNYTLDNYRTPDPVTSRFAYYDFMIRVLNFSYVTIDTEYYLKTSSTFYKTEWGKIVDKQDKQTQTVSKCVRYEGTGIIGFNYVVNYGMQKNMTLSPDGTPESPYIRVSTGETSMVEKWVPWIDDHQKATLKFRVMTQSITPQIVTYDKSLLANMDFGEGVSSILDKIEYMSQTGRMIVQRKGETMSKVNPHDAIHIQNIDSLTPIQTTQAIMGYCQMQIENLAGITPAVAASATEEPNKLVRVGEQQMAAANNAMHTIITAYLSLKERAARKLVSKMRVLNEYNPKTREFLASSIGEPYVKSLSEYKYMTTPELGITLKPKASPERKRLIMDMVNQSLAATRNGAIGIGVSDALRVESELENGSVELAAWYLTLAEERAFEKNQQAQLQMSKDNAEKQVMSSQAAAQSQERLLQMQAQIDGLLETGKINTQYQADTKLLQQEIAGKLEEIRLNNETKPTPIKTD